MCTVSGRQCQYLNTIDRRTRRARIGEKTTDCSRDTSVETGSDQNDGNRVDIKFSLINSSMQTGQVALTPDERWYLDFFRKKTSLQCAGYFYNEFWQRLVHQVSDVQPAVCHAVIAMASLNYKFLHIRMGGNTRPLDRNFHLLQCNKVIACLRQNMLEDHMSSSRVETALVTCVVLVSTMLFQEDAQSAGRHLQSGYKLLGGYLKDNLHPGSTGLAITQAFEGIKLGWLSFLSPNSAAGNGDYSFPSSILSALPETVDNLQQAGDSLLRLAPLVLHGSQQGLFQGAASLGNHSEHHAILSKLRGLRSQIHCFSVHHDGCLSQRDLDTLTLLKIWSEVLHIISIVETRPLPRETRYDEYLPQFQNAVNLAKTLLTSHASENSLPDFSVNMGIIPPLFFCAFKCRDWLIRQEALLLLRRWRRQEGIWSSCTTAQILKRVFEIESDGLTPEDRVPETSRIVSIDVEVFPQDSKLCLLYCRSGDLEGTAWTTEWMMYESAEFGNFGKQSLEPRSD